jgi:hypothetical protein
MMPTCFLAMGFGKKTAFYLGKKKPRTLTRHMKTSSSRMSPRPGSPGVRADEIQPSTMIDKPMYEQLLGYRLRGYSVECFLAENRSSS